MESDLLGCLLKSVFCEEFFEVVYLPIVRQVYMRERIQTHWLLSRQMVHDGEAVESQIAMVELRKAFNAEEIRPSVSDQQSIMQL